MTVQATIALATPILNQPLAYHIIVPAGPNARQQIVTAAKVCATATILARMAKETR